MNKTKQHFVDEGETQIRNKKGHFNRNESIEWGNVYFMFCLCFKIIWNHLLTLLLVIIGSEPTKIKEI